MYAGCIKPLCDLLNVNEVKIIKVAMEGLENILKVSFLDLKSCDCRAIKAWAKTPLILVPSHSEKLLDKKSSLTSSDSKRHFGDLLVNISVAERG